MMWNPYWVLTGFEIALLTREKAALSNGGTVWPLEMVSLPPWPFELGSCECFLARAAKSAPPWSCE
jgi:hypothetical protein